MMFSNNSLRNKLILSISLLIICPSFALGETAVLWDFSSGTCGWIGNAQVANMAVSAEGLSFDCTELDPWIEGPGVDIAEDKITRVTIRMRSTADKGGEVFYGKYFEPGRARKFMVENDGQWHDHTIIIKETLGRKTRFRLDPCNDKGRVTVAYIKVETFEKPVLPAIEKPMRVKVDDNSKFTIKSGELALRHDGKRFGGFVCDVAGKEMLIGYTAEKLGVIVDGKNEWLSLKNAQVSLTEIRGKIALKEEASATDSSGTKWSVSRLFRAGKHPETIRVIASVTNNKKGTVVCAPWLTLFSGVGTFGEHKTQGVLPGVEFLADEPSSSDADIDKPNHIRRTPDDVKITFPLMAIVNDECYAGLIWERTEMTAATFDSPDTVYKSGGHLMSLSGPGIGANRYENDFVGHSPFSVTPREPVWIPATIIGRKGEDATAAVKHYVELKGLPKLPAFEGGFEEAAQLLSHGWVDSEINEDGLIRHAVWPGFGAGPSSEAAMFMDQLSNITSGKLSNRLESRRDEALGKLPPNDAFASRVSHLPRPTAALVFGRIDEYVRMRKQQASAKIRRFRQDGTLKYNVGKSDYSRTHFADHANGLGARELLDVLEAAMLCGDDGLIDKAIKVLDKQEDVYANTVPRGAQTWEMPLHTPDVLAAAYLVRAYVLGYVITGEEKYLEQAKYWAWTGVPFVILDNPTNGKVGDYGIIAVYGATNWQAPVWFGLPVQWCGLVYAGSLYELAEFDSEGPWEQIAKGITLTGLNMSWPTTDSKRQGLLPDFFHLKRQVSDGPAINPGTIQAKLTECFDKGKLYDVKRLDNGWFIHAPCQIDVIVETVGKVEFKTQGWGKKPYHVLIAGVQSKPAKITAINTYTNKQIHVNINYENNDKLLILKLTEPAKITIAE